MIEQWTNNPKVVGSILARNYQCCNKSFILISDKWAKTRASAAAASLGGEYLSGVWEATQKSERKHYFTYRVKVASVTHVS